MKRFYLTVILVIVLISQLFADPIIVLDEPDSNLAANSGVDVVWDGRYLWVGTSKGLSGTENGGFDWITFNSQNGLQADEVSALEYRDGMFWVATSSSIISNGQTIPVGEGFAVTSDYGNNFVLDTPTQATGPGMICYDISAYDSVTYAACFYGGLIFTADGGDTWENLFPDTIAENDYVNQIFHELNNRFFCVAVDGNYENHDTVAVWAGSAAGLNQFQYIDRSAKLAGNGITDIFNGEDYTWIATDSGLSRSDNNGKSYRSYFESDGLTSNFISALNGYNDFVICAGYNPVNDDGTGFAFTIDDGVTWNQSTPDQSVGNGKKIMDIAIVPYIDPLFNDNIAIWAACSKGGLIRSMDTCKTWESVTLDPSNPSPDSLYNQFNTVDYIMYPPVFEPCGQADSLNVFAGTNGGLWIMNMHCPYETIEDTSLIRFESIANAGQKVADIETAMWITDDGGEVDTTYEIALATHFFEGSDINSILLSQDRGETWLVTLTGVLTNQLLYTDESILWAATDPGLRRYDRGVNNWLSFNISDLIKRITLDADIKAISFDTFDSLLWIGSTSGVANTPNALLWDIDTVQFDSDKFDHNVMSTSDSTLNSGLSGNFTVVVEVQYYDNERIIWAAGNSTGESWEKNGINISRNDGADWEVILENVNCWNIAFDGAAVYLATSEGLLWTPDFGATWDTLAIIDAQTGTEIYPETGFFGVANAEGDIWAASDDGVVKTSNSGTSWSIYRGYQSLPDATGVKAYVTPLPSSPFASPGGRLRFHYKFDNDGDVTIKVYDFAMNLVATPVENVARLGGTQYDTDSWDMRNDNGTIVATGPYYFKVENSSGEEEWGKIMVIP
jgi:hypothetical protein